MKSEIAKLLSEVEYDEVPSIEIYESYSPRKMTKKEFVRQMLRMQEEKKLYAE